MLNVLEYFFILLSHIEYSAQIILKKKKNEPCHLFTAECERQILFKKSLKAFQELSYLQNLFSVAQEDCSSLP